ncbi:DUF1294 domain-containing protein [Vreelandella olivaria]|uniref:DUF1294 domain-containing protein n=1 Tax=Vreelandella olivaria TaxID=390919 RepID=UPI0024C23554|nr:DUF1294 domain-containing protein [Halomonas olivaria]
MVIPVIAYYAVMSVLAYVTYAVDKKAAIHRRRRVRERTLHLLGVLGGWPGALLAQQQLRHKTRKTAFLVGFWLSVVLNLACVWWLIFQLGII